MAIKVWQICIVNMHTYVAGQQEEIWVLIGE